MGRDERSELAHGLDMRTEAAQTTYRACLLLDANDYAGFMALCDERFHYVVTAYSPEIRKEMIWLEHDRNGMQLLFNNLPRHNSDRAQISRHATVYTVDFDAAKDEAHIVAGLQVFRTTLDGGTTELFAVGKVYDTIAFTEAGPRLRERKIKLDTRQLGIGYHVPF